MCGWCSCRGCDGCELGAAEQRGTIKRVVEDFWHVCAGVYFSVTCCGQRADPNCSPGSFEVDQDPEPSDRVSGEVRLRVGTDEDRHISHLLPHLCVCPSGTSAGIARCLAETISTHLLQTEEKAFHLPTGFSIHV